MKKSTILAVLAAIVAGALFSFYAVAQEGSTAGGTMMGDMKKDMATDQEKMGKPAECPGCGAMSDKDWQTKHKEMMEKAGITKEMMSCCQAMMKAPIMRDDPAMIMGWEKELKLSDEQKGKLEEIAKEAREKAMKTLTDDQRKVIDSMPADKMTVMGMRREMHEKMMPMCKEMMKEGKMCCCPMMMHMRGGKSGKMMKEPPPKEGMAK